jgi:hypothetical protein
MGANSEGRDFGGFSNPQDEADGGGDRSLVAKIELRRSKRGEMRPSSTVSWAHPETKFGSDIKPRNVCSGIGLRGGCGGRI